MRYRSYAFGLGADTGQISSEENYDFRHSLRIQLLYPGVKMCNFSLPSREFRSINPVTSGFIVSNSTTSNILRPWKTIV